MKTKLIFTAFLLCTTTLFGQWTPVNNGLPDFPPTAIWPLLDDMVLGTYGGGIFNTTDNGENWNDISGNLGNLFVNDVRGFASTTSLLVATAGGPYSTLDLSDYSNNNSTGLSTTDVNYYWWGDEDLGGEFMVGTNGSGVFASDDYTGPWAPSNVGVLGDGLIVSDISGYQDEDVEFAVMATDGGTYWALDGASEWTPKNNGLSGDALKVKRIAVLGSVVFIATHGGLYFSVDLGNTWEALISNEKFNGLFIHATPASPSGFLVIVFGENGFYSSDFLVYYPMDFGGIDGEATAGHANSTHLFLGFTSGKKAIAQSGGVYKKPLDQVIVGIEENTNLLAGALLNQNYPNPFKQNTTFSYHISQPGMVSFKIYSYTGKLVKTLVNNRQEIGDYQINFKGDELPSGMYFYKLQLDDNRTLTKKMLIVN